jgi:D-inositol-3-phosphate glycosyltransferase
VFVLSTIPSKPRATAACRVLFVGHAGIPTGFARVLHTVLRHLPARYERYLFGITSDRSWRDGDVVVHGNSDRRDLHSPEALRDVIGRVRPEAVVVLDEPWVCSRLAPVLLGERAFASIFYGAADGDSSVPRLVAADLARLDGYVAFNAFGLGIVERQWEAIAAARRPLVRVIPHGVDTSAFHPLERRAARRALFGTDAHDNDFIVLNANRNQPFKRIDRTIEAFAWFARDKGPDVRLYLHMGTRPREAGETALVDRFGIRDRVLLTGPSEKHPHVPDARLNLIYNACDVGVNTSEKEGWGLIAFEHGATRAAQIVPRHSACAELWDGAALLVDAVPDDSSRLFQGPGRVVTVEGVAESLDRLYRDRDEHERMADAAFTRATRPEYQWPAIARQWDALFQDVVAITQTSPQHSRSA